MAVTQIAAIEEKAKTTIAIDSVNTQQKIFSTGITSEAARELIEALTPIENMMPRLEARVIERLFLEKQQKKRNLHLVEDDDD